MTQLSECVTKYNNNNSRLSEGKKMIIQEISKRCPYHLSRRRTYRNYTKLPKVNGIQIFQNPYFRFLQYEIHW